MPLVWRKSTHVSSMKHNPKYSFSFRLKCEATRSNSSRDNSLGWRVEGETQELSLDHLHTNKHLNVLLKKLRGVLECTRDRTPILVPKHPAENEMNETIPAPAAPASCHRGGEPGKDGLRSSRGRKEEKRPHETCQLLQESRHTASSATCASPLTAALPLF